MNTFGTHLRMHIFGESHGAGVGIVLDGVPPGVRVDLDAVQARLDARRPGTGPLVSSRKESDTPTFLSGVFNDHTTGAPLTVFIRNEDTRSKDYDALRRTPRPGHSDFVARHWSKGFYDHRGGGHYSGRLTAPLVAAAALLAPLLADAGITVGAHVHRIDDIGGPHNAHAVPDMRDQARRSPVHTAHADLEADMVAAVEAARSAKDSLGGIIEWKAEGVPVAWGSPFFDSVESMMAHLFFAIPAVKGVSFGAGFDAARMRGSEHNDPLRMRDDAPRPVTNHAGGILGGRSTGAPLWGHVAIKPTSSIFQPQDTVDLDEGRDATLELKGRHDPCIAIRAAPVVAACAEVVLVDLLLRARMEGHA